MGTPARRLGLRYALASNQNDVYAFIWAIPHHQTEPLGESAKTSGTRRLAARFFEHSCRDELDLKRCVDYTHVNPVKHHLVERVRDWPWSSFHRYVKLGEYEMNWGGSTEWFGDEFKWAE